MNIEYINNLEASLYYANRKIEELIKEKEILINYIKENYKNDDKIMKLIKEK